MLSDIRQMVAEAESQARTRGSGRPYAFMTEPGYVLTRPVSGCMNYVSAEAFELSSRERMGLAAENDQPWTRHYIIRDRYQRTTRGGDAGWGS